MAGAKPRAAWPMLVAPAVLAAALVLFLLFPRREPKLAGVHLYLNIAGEPEGHAIALDLDSKGDL